MRISARELMPRYLILFAVYLFLYTVVLLFSRIPRNLLNVYFAIQSIIVLALLSLDPTRDIVVGLFILLCYQVAMFFSGRVRLIWIAILVSQTLGSLVFYLGAIQGLGLGLTPTAGCIVLAFLVIANQEITIARTEGQALIAKLESSYLQLQKYTDQVEELSTLEVRNRLARELHDAVSQTMFGISLNTRSAQILLKQNHDQVTPHLEELQTLTNSALVELRSMVARLRPGTE